MTTHDAVQAPPGETARETAGAGRLDRAFLAAARYPDAQVVPVRFADLDIMWHVNNAAAIVLLQEARVGFSKRLGLPPLPEPLRMFVGAMTVEYANEIKYPGDVEISSGLRRIGRTSLTFAQVVRQNGAPCIFTQVTMVVVGPDGPHVPPEDWRAVWSQRALIG